MAGSRSRVPDRVFGSVVGLVWQLLSHSLLHMHMFPLFHFKFYICYTMLSIPNLITRSLPYGHFSTWILKHFRVPINEPSCKPSKSIGDEAVCALGFEWRNGALVKFIDIKYTLIAPSDDCPLNDVVHVDQLPDFSLPFRG